jgi:hypothetical protein
LHLASRLGAPLLALAVLALAAPAGAQDMNIALSRLSLPGSCEAGACAQDDEAYRFVMSEFAGAMIPPVLTPAGTRGVRGIYVGFETWFTGIESSEGAWHRAVEGDGGSTDTTRSTFVDNVIAWGRLNVRKGLPFGFELGTNISYMANSGYWALGAEVRWALFEGFRDGVGWIPDLAVRAAVQTLVGDGELNVTVPSVELILSEPFVVANTVELTPWVVGQVAFPFVDSELVDLTPETSGFTDSGDLNNSVVFPSLRSTRWRMGAGLQIRYEWFTLLGNFMFDLVKPGDAYADDSLPDRLNRQWQADVAVGLTL